MTVINSTRLLEQHLLTYLKARWTTATMRGVPIQAGFTTWVLGRGDTFNPNMTLHLAGFTTLAGGQNATALAAFVAGNLPSDNESVQDYVVRFVFDRLQNQELIDDTACQYILANLTFVTSATANATLATWWTALTPTARPTAFPAAVAAFKQHLTGTNQVLTGQAVLALSQSASFNYDAWVAQQLNNVITGATADVRLPKIQEDAACWSWALSACGNTAVSPDDVMTWLHSPLPAMGPDPSMPAAIAAILGGPKLPAKNDLIAVKALLHQHNMATLDPAYDPTWVTDPTRTGHVAGLNTRVYSAILTLNNFVVAQGSQFGVAVEYKVNDGVSWEHWWVEYAGAVVETFPTMKFALNLTRLRQVARMTPTQAAQYNVIRIDVQGLLPQHHTTLGAGLAQYL